MAKRDYLRTFWASPKGADEKELKSAFRKLAMQFHPDRNPGDKAAEHKFKEINEAYETLKDPQKRAAYDRFGHAAFENGGMGGGGAGGFGPDFASSMSDIFDDMFGEFMGGGAAAAQRRGGRERGADLRYNMEITLEEAFAGKTAQIRVPTSVTCEACSGSGAKPGTAPTTCPTCGGAGQGARQRRASSPSSAPARPARAAARSINDPCPNCARPGPRHRGAHAVGQHPGRHRGRHAHPPRRRGRGRPARRPAGRPLHLPVDQAARVLPARRRRPLLQGADLDDDGGARRRHSRCRRSTARRRA